MVADGAFQLELWAEPYDDNVLLIGPYLIPVVPIFWLKWIFNWGYDNTRLRLECRIISWTGSLRIDPWSTKLELPSHARMSPSRALARPGTESWSEDLKAFYWSAAELDSYVHETGLKPSFELIFDIPASDLNHFTLELGEIWELDREVLLPVVEFRRDATIEYLPAVM